MMGKKELKKLFKNVYETGKVFDFFKRKFDIEIEKRWEFHYSDYDIDEIIDTLDYHQGKMSFNRFEELMNEQKQKLEDSQ